MPKKITVRTPLGEFPSMNQAIKALRCDRNTLLRRFQQEPDLYACTTQQVPARPRRWVTTVRGPRWPISWQQYRVQDEAVKQAIWEKWCQDHNQDPETEAAAEAFFDEMDQYQSLEDAAEATQDQDLEHESLE